MHRLLAASALMIVAIAQGAGTQTARATASSAARLAPDGIGSVRFGLPKGRAVASLSDLFGAPAAQGVNTGCGPRYTEVAWGDLVAEFRSKTFSGYRYVAGGYPLTTPGSPREPRQKAVFPRLATSRGITLRSTLAQLRQAYTALHSVGTNRWQAGNGLVFVDHAQHDPEPPSSHIIEIKIGTCGDF
jgi:hypothetical protein